MTGGLLGVWQAWMTAVALVVGQPRRWVRGVWQECLMMAVALVVGRAALEVGSRVWQLLVMQKR